MQCGGVKRLRSVAQVCALWYCSFLPFQPATHRCHCAPCYICGYGDGDGDGGEIVIKSGTSRKSIAKLIYIRL